MADRARLTGAMRGWRPRMLFGLGSIAALGQAPTDLWPLTPLALAGVFALHKADASPRQAAFALWLVGLGYFAVSLRWIIEPFLVDIARHGWMAPFAIVLMAGGLAGFWALAGGIAQRIKPGSVVVLALAMVWAEVARSLILTGFPWALLGHIWVPTWFAQAAAWGGPHLLTVLTVSVALAVTAIVRAKWVAGLGGVVALAMLALALRPGLPAPFVPDAPIVRIVQPNAPQDQKWALETRDIYLSRLIAHTAQPGPRDLVVWPETSVPYLLQSIEQDLPFYADTAQGAPLVFGIQRRDGAWNAYNSLVVLGPGGTLLDLYDKRHLVPFGEYIPGANLLGAVGAAGLVGEGFSVGARVGPVDLPGIGGAVPLICYEGIFAEEIWRGPDRARLLLLITNDAWFGQAAGPLQHLAQARLRAIEQGLPMVRVANTGISAMIDAKGRIVAAIPMDRDGFLDVRLPPVVPLTLYARWGEGPFLALFGFLSLLILVLGRAKPD